MAVLLGRTGCVEALRCIAAASSAGVTIAFQALADLAAVRLKGSNPFGSNVVVFSNPPGAALTHSNSIAKLLLGSSAPAAVDQWLEWEECCLRPASYLAASPAHDQLLPAALQHLETALAAIAAKGSAAQHLVGSSLTAADLAVYSTLLPLQQRGDGALLPATVTAWMGAVGALEPVKAATEQVLAGQPLSTISQRHAEAAAAYVASRPKLPIPGQRNILITSALPYVNNVPHLGNIIGCVLSADCYARFCRSRGYNCVYVCGTDEYGTATETKALEEGLTPQQICDKYHAIHADIYKWFDIAFDRFGRTPSRWQTQICQDMYHALDERGFLVEASMEQLFSEALGKFLPDRFVYGTCPKCGYEDARGDQCDNCGNLLNPTELIRPKCKVTGTTPVLRNTHHVFLDLPQLQPQLQEYITRTSELGGWSKNCVQVTNAWMRDGLKQRCITRDLVWGTPVPRPGYEKKVFYVWFDAPIGYISITANYTPEWELWWKDPKDVELVQFMGKDNVPFHTVIFPSTLLGSGQPWTMMKKISVTEYLNYEGGKFSKSRGTGVFGNDAQETGIPVEVWRYYLLANRPETSDTDFQWSDLAARNNAELLANLGNFVNRILKFVNKFFDGKVPVPTSQGLDAVTELGKTVRPKVDAFIDKLDEIKIREAAVVLMSVSSDANKFMQDNKPWELAKNNPDACATVVAASVGLVRLLAALMQPYMPSLTAKILTQLALPATAADLNDELIAGCLQPHTLVAGGHVLGTPEPIVQEITPEVVAALRARFGGSQAERSAAAPATAGAAAAASPATTSAGAGQLGKDGKPATAGKAAAKPKGAAPGAKPAAAAAAGEPAAAGDATAAAAPADASTSEGKAAEAGDKKSKKAAAKEAGSADGAAAGGAAGGGGKKKPAAAAEEGPVDVSRIDIRVGQILKVWRHPDADSLYVEEIDVGEAQPRQVVSGLVRFIPESEMQGRRVVVVCNLKPANMRGVSSQAMVMAASSAEGDKVELVEPPAGASVGERISFAAHPGTPDEQLNPKKKIFEAVQPDLKTVEGCVATYKGDPFTTSAGPCRVATLVGASIK